MFTLDLHCLSKSFIWVLEARHYWANLLCSNNIELSLLSERMVYISVNNLSVLSGYFISFWAKPVLSRKDTTQCPGESRTSGPSDIALGYM